MKELTNLLSGLKGTSKPGEKQQIIKDYDSDFLRYVLKSAYEPFVMYHIKLKLSEIPAPGEKDIVDIDLKSLLDFCVQSQSPKQNRTAVIDQLSLLTKGSQDLLIGILNKNLKCGLGVRNILKVFPGLISRFEVQLANTYKEAKKYKVKKVLWSYKLDGLRCIALRIDGEWKLRTRKGKMFLTVDHLKEQLEFLYEKYGYTFFDGELYKHGLKFEEVQSLVMGFKKGTAHNMEYHVFVAGSAESFLNQRVKGIVALTDTTISNDLNNIVVVQTGVVDMDRTLIMNILDVAFSIGYEGIMLRDIDVSYDFKRSDKIIKLKSNGDEGEELSDCTVLEIKTDLYPVIVEVERERIEGVDYSNIPYDDMFIKIMKYENLLVKLIVKQKDGIECKVGSGFSLEFRREYTKSPENIIGKTVEILHQGYGANNRMRFPRLKRIREDL